MELTIDREKRKALANELCKEIKTQADLNALSRALVKLTTDGNGRGTRSYLPFSELPTESGCIRIIDKEIGKPDPGGAHCLIRVVKRSYAESDSQIGGTGLNWKAGLRWWR